MHPSETLSDIPKMTPWNNSKRELLLRTKEEGILDTRGLVTAYRRAVSAIHDLDMEQPLRQSIDRPLQRLSGVLIKAGYLVDIASEKGSCGLPSIYFKCSGSQKMRHLTWIITSRFHPKNFCWTIELTSSEPFITPKSPLRYVLTPKSIDRIIDPIKDKKLLQDDIDLITVYLYNYFWGQVD